MAEHYPTDVIRPNETVVVTPSAAGTAPPAGEPSLTSLVAGIISDAQTLIRQELKLAKVEIKAELTKTRDAAISFVGAAGALVWAVVMLTFGLAHFIAWAANWPTWAGFAVVGGLCLAAGVVLFFIGKNRAEDINIVPQQTVETMQENMQWIQNPK